MKTFLKPRIKKLCIKQNKNVALKVVHIIFNFRCSISINRAKQAEQKIKMPTIFIFFCKKMLKREESSFKIYFYFVNNTTKTILFPKRVDFVIFRQSIIININT